MVGVYGPAMAHTEEVEESTVTAGVRPEFAEAAGKQRALPATAVSSAASVDAHLEC